MSEFEDGTLPPKRDSDVKPSILETPQEEPGVKSGIPLEECLKIYLNNYGGVLERDLESIGLVEPLQRILFVGKFNHSSIETVKQKWTEIIHELADKTIDDSSRITGILILTENYFYNVIESSSDAIDDCIKATGGLIKQDIIIGTRIIAIIFEIPARYFNFWSCAIIRGPESEITCETPPTIEEPDFFDIGRYVETMEQLNFSLSDYIQSLEPDEVESELNFSLPITILPTKEMLSDLYKESRFLTVESHIQMYINQQVYTLSDEVQWPPVEHTDFLEHLDTLLTKAKTELEEEENQLKKTMTAKQKIYSQWVWD